MLPVRFIHSFNMYYKPWPGARETKVSKAHGPMLERRHTHHHTGKYTATEEDKFHEQKKKTSYEKYNWKFFFILSNQKRLF